MLAAFFALAGALVGVVGSAVADAMREKRELRRRNQDELRSTCADFTSQLGRVRRYLFAVQDEPQNEELWKLIDSAFTEARAHNERLLITAESAATQEAADRVIACTSGMIRARKMQSGEYSEFRNEFDRWLEKLYVSIREELGLRNPANLYMKRLSRVHIDPSIGGIQGGSDESTLLSPENSARAQP